MLVEITLDWSKIKKPAHSVKFVIQLCDHFIAYDFKLEKVRSNLSNL